MSIALRRDRIPNLISWTRVCLAPSALLAAVAGQRWTFLGIVAGMLLSDMLDGMLARRWHAFSDRGRLLDSVGDYLMIATAAAGVALLWPQTVRQEWPWLLAGGIAYYAIVAFGLIRWRRVPGYHTIASKVVAVLFGLALVPLLAQWSPVPMRIVVSLQIIAAVEELAIAIRMPAHRGSALSYWHARQAR